MSYVRYVLCLEFIFSMLCICVSHKDNVFINISFNHFQRTIYNKVSFVSIFTSHILGSLCLNNFLLHFKIVCRLLELILPRGSISFAGSPWQQYPVEMPSAACVMWRIVAEYGRFVILCNLPLVCEYRGSWFTPRYYFVVVLDHSLINFVSF